MESSQAGVQPGGRGAAAAAGTSCHTGHSAAACQGLSPVPLSAGGSEGASAVPLLCRSLCHRMCRGKV